MNTDFDTAHLVYLIVLGCAVMMWFFAANRDSLGKTLQQAAVWGAIFIGVIAAIGLWDDVRGTVAPRQSVSAEAGRIELPRAPDGHYYLDAEVNGAPIRFVVDTGASDIVLSREDAAAAGLRPENLNFTGQASTANGIVRTAPVRLDTISVEGLSDRGVRAVVNSGELRESLLGMGYLERFRSVQITGGTLILER
ncbi:aspartyl protease family protein [Roseovarius nanhaiticus]|uniref:Aspartyl protease family protein n=1 Tax=Roseovarius nanhaiticus TaxID=573024 RepID=A0A1N7GC37_9RHOB|nr:TIGR02281 family clan AA aspartic protease [Roseovarius nanhaiticus]SEK31215.1 aspartyl protease family protein [Roseovarius nanhaiticus]SIS10147.1 aspartyl protease family protein [Roseovarius nanhaiticus]